MTGSALARASDAGQLVDEHDYGRMRVWIDQDLCTGDGICEDYCPTVFVILEDGIAYVREGSTVRNNPGLDEGTARVQVEHEPMVISAASDCPGECIFIELAA